MSVSTVDFGRHRAAPEVIERVLVDGVAEDRDGDGAGFGRRSPIRRHKLRGFSSSRLGYHEGMTTMEILVAKAKALPPEGQREVLDFVEFLGTRLGRGTPHKSLSGVLADLGVDLSAEDIDQARREAWAEFPRRDL